MLDETIRKKFLAIVGNNNFKDDNATLLAYSYDSTAQFQALPDAVITPRNKMDVQAIVNICDEHHIPIVLVVRVQICVLVQHHLKVALSSYLLI